MSTDRVELRVPRADLIRWRVTASADGLALSKWIRRICDASAMDQKTLDMAKKKISDRRKRGAGE